MIYLPSKEDLRILKNHSKYIYCRIDLLDKSMATIDSLLGVTVSGTINVDADSDIRRTFSSTIYLSEKYEISKYSEEEWINKYIRVYIGLKNEHGDINWYSQGIYAFQHNGFTYNAEEHTVSISCIDLVSQLDGSLAGQLTGKQTTIEQGAAIRGAIQSTVTQLGGIGKYMIDYWNRTVPYELEFDTGSTVWEILTQLRDLYYPFEMYFDDDTFVCKEIPNGIGDPAVLDADIFDGLVISESADVDYSEVKNCVEVFGKCNDSDFFAETTEYDAAGNCLVLNTKQAITTGAHKFAFVMPEWTASETLQVKIVNTTTRTEGGQEITETETVGPYTLYDIIVAPDGDDVVADASVLKANKYYVVKYDNSTHKFYYVGQQQAHAMVKLVSRMPTDEEYKAEQEAENCDNLKFIQVNSPDDTSGLYNSRFTIEQIGRRNLVLSGGDYENYDSDEAAMQVCEYEHWKRCRLTDTVTVDAVLVPWLTVNEKISYTARYMNKNIPVEFIIKRISMELGSGTMTITMSRYFPYYPYIIENKY